MLLEKIKGNWLIKKIDSKASAFASNKYFTGLLFLIVFFFFIFDSFRMHELIQNFYLSFLAFIVSLAAVFFLFKFHKFFPVVSLGAILVFFSFFSQKFDLAIEYNVFYFLGFGLISASMIYALIEQNKKFFWISLFLLFASTLSPLITPQILIGDERVLLDNTSRLESGLLHPSDFGKHNYVNVSFVYFYYLVIIAKIFGTTVANIFFLLKFFFLLLIFLSFYLLATRFIEEKLVIFAILIAFFPIQNLHLAPQMIGKFIIFPVFIYLYLKYFNKLNSRVLLVVMMLLITYINLTTLYISLAVFGFFVFLFFFKNAISRKAYFTDIIILFLFIILVSTYSTSIDLFGLAESFSDVEGSISGIGGNVSQAIVSEEDLSSKVNPFEVQETGQLAFKEIVPEEKFIEIPFLRRFAPFINNYVLQFGMEQLVLKLLNYFLLSILVLTVFFLFPDKRQIFVFNIAIFFLVLFLIHIQFQDGVHATLELTSLVMGVCIVLVFYRKPLYFIPLMLLFVSSISAPVLFGSTQYGESAELFASEFSSKELIGKNLVNVTMFGSFGSKEYLSNSGFVVSCVDLKPFEFYLNGVYLRCDDFSRMPLGKKIYDSSHSKAYLVLPEDLAEFK